MAGRQRDKEDKKRKLIAAATKLFALHGFDGATTRGIASAAGCSEALIMRYFASKEGLFQAVLADRAGAMSTELGDVEVDDLTDDLCALLHAEADDLSKERDFVRIALSRGLHDQTFGTFLGAQIYSDRVDSVTRRLKKHRTQGTIAKKADIESAAVVLTSVSFALSFFARTVFLIDDDTIDKQLRNVATMVARSLAADRREKSR